jgi:hypothetical protein
MKCRNCSKNLDDYLPNSMPALMLGFCSDCEKEFFKSAEEIESQEVTE